jgi:DNA-binding NarL/FixJ family response regulator
MEKTVRIAIAEDHEILRESISDLLNSESLFDVRIRASNGKELLDAMRSTPIDIVLLDLDMPVMNGHEAIVKIKRYYPKIKVLILSMHDSRLFVAKLLSKGANGYIPKGGSFIELCEAIRHLQEHDYFITELVTEVLIEQSKSKLPYDFRNLKGEQLSCREVEVLRLICGQLTGVEIAEKLSLSKRTVESHRNNILSKAGIKNSIGLVEYAIKAGYYEIEL